MRKNLSTLFLLPLLVSLTGCVSYFAGFPTNSTQLNQPNFHYVKQNVSGQSTATYIIGIGGNDHVSMVAEAKENLLSSYPLAENQALANVVVDFKFRSVLGPLFGQKVCTYTADIVEFRHAASTPQQPVVISNTALNSTSGSSEKATKVIADDRIFLFEHPDTKEKYSTHLDFTRTTNYQELAYTYASNLINTHYVDKGYFLPNLDELKYLYKEIDKFGFIPRKIFWSSELLVGKVKCFSMETGQVVLLDKNETAYVLPLKMIK
jgi:hypothetical protein